ncbi:MAG: ankyrin repeat domain-containing protein [Gammaproteobacteria bacterium]|nr:ankyrin repeat domain-containing protein [Gammaproteobacteria bacterium]
MAPRITTCAAATLVVLVLTACTTQPPEPPPPPPPPAEPTMDLWTAAFEGNIAELAANKHAGSDLDAQSPNEIATTALTMAAVGGQAEAAQWLLDNGANVNSLNGDGSTALNAAAFLGRAGVAKVLIDGGVDTSIRSYEGASAADIAQLDWDTTEYIAALLQLQVDRETVESGRAKILAMIAGPSEASTRSGYEELAYAILMDDAAAAKTALGAGADANARDPNIGGTPLIFAALMGRIEIAKMLLAAGADINATDNNGTNALTVAELDWQTTQDIAAMFQIPLTNPEAIKKGKVQIAKMLRAKM